MGRLSLRVMLWMLPLWMVAGGLGLLCSAHSSAQDRPVVLAACDLPCWAGITIRETSLAEIAPQLVASFPDVQVSSISPCEWFSFNGHIDNRMATGRVHYDDHTVDCGYPDDGVDLLLGRDAYRTPRP